MNQQDVRFGIAVGDRRSRTWRVRSGARVPELFIERETLEDAFHLSLHASGQWHLKHNRDPVVRWPRPAELVPGFTRAVAVFIPSAVALFEDAAPAGSVIVPASNEDGRTPQFSVFIEAPGSNLASWPGARAERSDFVGRIQMADGSTCCVVVTRNQLDPGELHLNIDPSQGAELKRRAASGTTMMTLVAEASDGALVLIDGRAAGADE